MTDRKESVALGSVAVSAGLTIGKAVVGLMSGSLAILSEAAHSLIDFVATVMTYFAIRWARKPADEEHHYGHGKIESIAALAETMLLFGLSGVVIWEAGRRLLSGGEHVEATIWAFGIIVVSIVLDFFRARLLYHVAHETSSEALEADALHFDSDMWSSIAVLIGLGGVWLGYPRADTVAALIVAVFVCVAGWRLARRTLATLTDTAPAGVAEQLTGIAERVAGVVSVERVRARRVGDTLFADLTVAVSRALPLDRVTAIKQRVATDARAALGKLEVNVGTHPVALDTETIVERVMVIARNRALAVHHVTVHAIDARLAISLDLEVDGALALGAAHDIATALEAAIADELGPDVEVETHIEPLQPDDLAGRDADGGRVAEVQEALAASAATAGMVRDVHDVRVRATDDGEIVNFHCRVTPGETVHAVHEEVDEIERALRRRWPSIKRVIGHAEPMRSTDKARA